MGAVAMFYFFAAAFVMAVACSGPDIRAKFCSAYLLGAWAMSNHIWVGADPNAALDAFTWPDAIAASLALWALLIWPSRWLAVVAAALTTQVIFQIHHSMQDPMTRQAAPANWVNELLYDVQLVATCTPTVAQTWRRLRRRRRARKAAEIPPPYPAWENPLKRQVGD